MSQEKDQDNTASNKEGGKQSGGGWSSEGAGYLQDKVAKQRVLVIYPHTKTRNTDEVVRSPEARLSEAIGLAEAIDIDLVDGLIINVRKVKASHYIGQGHVDDLHKRVGDDEVDLIVFDCELSPIQQRNLERDIDCKVIDRTALILEIFGARASTKEGELQVELAHLSYQKSRLVRSWTHLERQRGGAGFLGGPGESQIELDRRMITDRIVRLKKSLEQVTRTRHLHRARREKAPYPVVALVGYTNAGKSTLFNYITKAEVLAEDMLFATLDPTMRAVDLPSGRRVILSDTVGFISELPTMLVAAFRATLEEVTSADLIVHVRDASHPDSDVQRQDVIKVLKDLDLDLESEEEGVPVFEALNKIDLASEELRECLMNLDNRKDDVIALSAITGEGCDRLIEAVDEELALKNVVIELMVPYADGRTNAWVRANAEIISEENTDMGTEFCFTVDPIDWERFKSRI